MRKFLKYFFSAVLITCIIILSCIFFDISTQEYENYKVEKIANMAGAETTNFVPNWDSLRAINPDIVAWIYYPAADISYPVLQSSDNTYYLKHDFNKAANDEGAIFLDCDNNSDFTDKNNIIYGHTIFGWRGMFSGLKNLTNKTFFDTNNKFILFTPDATYRCDIFSFESTVVNTLSYQLDFVLGNQIVTWSNQIKANSLYANEDVKIGKNSRVLTLSTCAAMDSSKRYIVHAKITVDNKIKSSDIG